MHTASFLGYSGEHTPRNDASTVGGRKETGSHCDRKSRSQLTQQPGNETTVVNGKPCQSIDVCLRLMSRVTLL